MKQTYRVGEVARYFGVSEDTLRLYDKLGIISPVKTANNYRSYSREDFICLAYVMQLRKINLPLEEIRKLLNESSIESAEAMMQMQEKLLEDKIAEMVQLKRVVQDYRLSYSNVIMGLGKIEIAECPTLIYQEIQTSMIRTMEDFSRLTQRQVPKFTFVVKKELFLSREFENFNEAKEKFFYAITLKDDDHLGERKGFPDDTFRLISPRKCVFSVARCLTHVDYGDFLKVRQFILDQKLEVTDDVFFRVISNNKTKNIDYYEVWVPIR